MVKRKREVAAVDDGDDDGKVRVERDKFRRDNRALTKRLRQIKHELAQRTRENQSLTDRDEVHGDALFAIHSSWSSVCENLNGVLNQLHVESCSAALTTSTASIPKGDPNAFIRMFIEEQNKSENEGSKEPESEASQTQQILDRLKPSLDSLAKTTQKLVSAVITALNNRLKETETMCELIKQASAEGKVDRALAERNISLEQQCKELREKLAQLQADHKKQRKSLRELEERELNFNSELWLARADRENLRWDLSKAHTEIETQKAAVEQAQKAAANATARAASAASGTVAQPKTTTEDGESGTNVELEIKIDEMTAKIDAWKQIAGNRLDQQQATEKEVEKLKNEINELKANKPIVSDSNHNQAAFISLQGQSSAQKNQVSRLQQELDEQKKVGSSRMQHLY